MTTGEPDYHAALAVEPAGSPPDLDELLEALRSADESTGLGAALPDYLARRAAYPTPVGFTVGYRRLLVDAQAARRGHRRVSQRRQDAVAAFRRENETHVHMLRAQTALYAEKGATGDDNYRHLLDLLITAEGFLAELRGADDGSVARLACVREVERRAECARRREGFKRWERGEASPEEAACIAGHSAEHGMSERQKAHVVYGTGAYLPRGLRAVSAPGLTRPRRRGAGRPRCTRRRTVRSSARSGDSGDSDGEGEPAGRHRAQGGRDDHGEAASGTRAPS
jgi:hypothetical protein